MRLFVSVDLPDALAEPIADVQEPLAETPGIRTTDPTQAHVTLKFLGEVSPDRLDELETALEAAITDAGVSPFEARVAGLGAFPSTDYIRVIWLGFDEGEERLATLQAPIETRLVECGFDPADHDFTPHVTIARMDDARGKDRVQEFLTDRDPSIGTIQVESVSLTESTLTDSGPEYTTVRSVPLP